jgi:hypothetical protein
MGQIVQIGQLKIVVVDGLAHLAHSWDGIAGAAGFFVCVSTEACSLCRHRIRIDLFYRRHNRLRILRQNPDHSLVVHVGKRRLEQH